MNIKKLDKVFSKYIRLRDADEIGMVKCCTCNSWYHWSEIHAGHYISRKCMITRFDEDNVHGQCVICNILKDGQPERYREFLKEKYHTVMPDVLLSRSYTTVKFTQYEIDKMVEVYKEKIKNLQ